MKPKYIIFFIFFFIIIYIISKSGNNIISKSEDMIIEKILKATEYNAKAKVTVYSNKNKNQYEVELYENFEKNYSLEKVLPNKDCSGFEIELKDNVLAFSNTEMNLKKIYKNYNAISKNYLFLSNFIKEADFENIVEENNKIIVKAIGEKNNYLHSKILYLDKTKNEIEKMVITDNEQHVKINIEYIEIQLN